MSATPTKISKKDQKKSNLALAIYRLPHKTRSALASEICRSFLRRCDKKEEYVSVGQIAKMIQPSIIIIKKTSPATPESKVAFVNKNIKLTDNVIFLEKAGFKIVPFIINFLAQDLVLQPKTKEETDENEEIIDMINLLTEFLE